MPDGEAWTMLRPGKYDPKTQPAEVAKAHARMMASAPKLAAALDLIYGIATNDNGEAGEHELRQRMFQVALECRMALNNMKEA
jgi:hypothetical protein